MKRLRIVVLGLSISLALGGAARAGGPFEQLVGVGADAHWRTIRLAPTGARSDAALFRGGERVPVPRSGYVRLFPVIGGLPGIPGRYYPGRALCLGWHDPVDLDCRRLGPAASHLLRPFEALPLRTLRPTVAVEVRHRSRVLRYADGNVFAALELALDRRPKCCPAPPRAAVPLEVRWRGPAAAKRPREVRLGPQGVYARGRLYPLGRGVSSYVAINLPPRS